MDIEELRYELREYKKQNNLQLAKMNNIINNLQIKLSQLLKVNNKDVQ